MLAFQPMLLIELCDIDSLQDKKMRSGPLNMVETYCRESAREVRSAAGGRCNNSSSIITLEVSYNYTKHLGGINKIATAAEVDLVQDR